MADASVVRFRQVVEVALRHLEARREEINDLNVYPVADGDTGDNMAQTMGAVRQALAALEAQSEDANRALVVETVRRAALLGARGNSGAITSQIVRGAAEVLATQPGRLIDAGLVAEALDNAAKAARAAVSKPTEGTILSAIDAMAEAAVAVIEEAPPQEVSGSEDQNAVLASMLGRVLAAGEEAVRRTPEQLQVLADAETVDAGAHALVILVRGLIAGLIGDDAGLPELPAYAPAKIAGIAHSDSRHRWCMNLIIRGEGLVPTTPPGLAELGDSIEVVGEDTMLRVHVHTDQRDAVEELCLALGEVNVDSCEDMHIQVAARAARAAEAALTSAVVVSNGPGFDRIFAEVGAVVVAGGATMNSSTAELLAGIAAAPGAEVVVFPNSPNIVLAAQEAAREAGPKVKVIEACASPQLAVELLLELDLSASADQVVNQAKRLAEVIRTGAVAEAAREDPDGRFAVGDAVGFAGTEIVAWGDPGETLKETLAVVAGGAEVASVFSGATTPLPDALVSDLAPAGVELDVRAGGQPAHWWLIAAQ